MKRLAVITKEDDWYVALDAISHVASQGQTAEEAVMNLKEALFLYYEDEAPQNEAEFVSVEEVVF